MSILEVIERDIRDQFPVNQRKTYKELLTDNVFKLHCSRAVYEGMKESFLKTGFLIGEELPIDIQFAKFQIPHIGTIDVIIDMETGYKLEKH